MGVISNRGYVIQHRFGNQESHCDGSRVTSGSAGEPIKGEKEQSSGPVDWSAYFFMVGDLSWCQSPSLLMLLYFLPSILVTTEQSIWWSQNENWKKWVEM